MTGKILIHSTCGSAEEAGKIARHLVDLRLAACVTVVVPVKSYYRWQGAVETSEEWLLVIKSSAELFGELKSAITAVHSYEVPEVIAMPILEGAENYLRWMEGELKRHD